jgi:hypothetical protein
MKPDKLIEQVRDRRSQRPGIENNKPPPFARFFIRGRSRTRGEQACDERGKNSQV